MTSISVRWMNLDTPMKHQMKHHQVFIWDETCFSSEIKHLHFNEINFLLFHLRRHVKNSGFVLYHGFQIPRNRWKHSACGLVLSSVSQYLEPVIKHSPSFLTYYIKHWTLSMILWWAMWWWWWHQWARWLTAVYQEPWRKPPLQNLLFKGEVGRDFELLW